MLARVVALPLGWHAAALGLVILLVLPLVGPYGSVSMDDGAAAHQAIALERGDGWSMEAPIPAIDAEDLIFPVTKSEPTDDGWAPFARRSEEHTSELQSLMRISYAVLC